MQDITLEITELLQWLEHVELQLFFSKPAWGHPDTTKEKLAAHLVSSTSPQSAEPSLGGAPLCPLCAGVLGPFSASSPPQTSRAPLLLSLPVTAGAFCSLLHLGQGHRALTLVSLARSCARRWSPSRRRTTPCGTVCSGCWAPAARHGPAAPSTACASWSRSGRASTPRHRRGRCAGQGRAAHLGLRTLPSSGVCGCPSRSASPLCLQERLAEGLTVTTEFHGTMQELLRWVAHAEELLSSPAPPSFILDTVTVQIQEHKASVAGLARLRPTPRGTPRVCGLAPGGWGPPERPRAALALAPSREIPLGYPQGSPQ